MYYKKTSGFTLIELMIVVAVIGILAAVAYPSYTDSVRKSRRADATSVLIEAQNDLERFYTENGAYDEDVGGNAYVLPTDLQSSPKGSNTTFYAIAADTSVDPQEYTLTATPQGDQANDSCGNLSLNQVGLKTASSGTTEDCW